MDVQLIRSFVEIASYGSVSAAARATGFSQPTVTAHLQALERHVGESLFRRHGRGVTLTDVGALLLPHARSLLSDYERFLGIGAHAMGTSTVRVGYWPPALQPLMDRLVAAAAARLPAVVVDAEPFQRPSDIEHDLLIGRRDVHLVPGPVTDPRLIAYALLPMRIGVRMSAGHPLSTRASVDADALTGLPSFRFAGAPWGWDSYWLGAERPGGSTAVVAAERQLFQECLEPIGDDAAVIICPAFMRAHLPPADTWRPLHGYRPAAVEVAFRRREDRPAVLAVTSLWVLIGRHTAQGGVSTTRSASRAHSSLNG